MSGQNSENVDIIVAVLKNMKTRERNSCIKQIKTIINSSGLSNNSKIKDWFATNGFLCEESYILG